MEQPRRYTLRKEERLKSRKTIEHLFSTGHSFSVFPIKVFWLMLEKPGEVMEAGFGASTRNFKSAVDRNRIKRLMREAYRLQKDPLIGSLKQAKRQLAVFFIYTGSTLPEYRHVYARITAACKRLIKITDENTPADT